MFLKIGIEKDDG